MVDEKKIKLLDLVELEVLQNIQDAFANAMNMGSLIVDDDGPITKPSGFRAYCTDFIMKSEKGMQKCNECIVSGSKKAAETNKPYLYKCHAGLTHFAIPIVVEGESLATIIGGQIVTDKLNNDFLSKMAVKLDLDPQKTIEASKELSTMAKVKVESAVQLLYIVANNISEIAHKNLVLLQRNKEQTLYNNINDAIRNTLDLNEMKKKIVDFIGKTMKADRCFIAEYDRENDKFLIIKDEYTASNKTPKYAGADANIDVPNFINELKKGKHLIIKDKEIFINDEKKEYREEKDAIEKDNVNSAYAVPFFYEKNLLGVLVVHYLTDKHKITKEEIDFMLNIVNSVAVAFYQAKLYEKLKKTITNQNALLNNMPFMAWLKNKESVLIAVNNAYAEKCNTSVENLIGKTDFDFFPKEEAELYVKEDQMVMQIKQTVSSNEIISGADGTKWYETYKSPVIDNNGKIIGTVGLSRDISEMIEAESEILNKQKQILIAKERETLLRKITETIIDSPDINETKQRIVEIVGETLYIDRVIIVEYDNELKKFLLIEQEYLSSDKISSTIGLDINEISPNFVKDIITGKSTLVNNGKVMDLLIYQNFEPEKEVIQIFQVNSLFNTPLTYKGELLGVLSVSYTHEHFIDDEEIDLIKTVARQVSIAIHQARLYKQMQIQLKKERVIKNIIEKAILTSNEEEIMKTLVTGAGELLNTDRCFFVEYDPLIDTSLPVKSYAEYLSSDKILSHMISPPTKESVAVFIDATKQRKNIVVENIEKIELPVESKKMLIDDLKVKSYLVIPVYYENQLYGSLVFHYVNNYKEFTHDEVSIAEIIANQTASVIYQSRLAIANKKKTERENLLSSILSKAISTFDINEIKQVVKEIGQLMKADRCYFVEVDLENMKGKPIDFGGEYLASDDIKSIIGYEFPSFDVQRFVELYSENKNLAVFDYEELSQNKDEYYKGVNAYSSTFDLKSGIGIPFIYMNKLTAVLCIEYVKEKVIPNEDELEFLKILGNQIGVIFNQMQQFKNAKETAQREALLRNIMDKMRRTLDLEEIMTYICKEISKLFDVQRVAITTFPDSQNYKKYIIKKEYLKSPETKGILGISDYSTVAEYWGNNLIKENKTIGIDNILTSDTPDYFKEKYSSIGIKAMLATAIRKGEDIWGTLILSEYRDIRPWSEEDKLLLKAIADQVYISINQAELYEKEKLRAEKEKLLRQIIETIKSTSDIFELKRKVITEVANTLNANRCYIADFDEKLGKYIPVSQEYVTSPELKSMIGFDVGKNIPELVEYVKDRSSVLISDVEKFIEKNNFSDSVRNYFQDFDIKSRAYVRISYMNNFFGTLIVNFSETREKFTNEDIEFIETVANQIGIAMYQYTLFNTIKKTAQTEKLLRNIIEVSRKSLIFEEVLTDICKSITMNFNVGRVSIGKIPEDKNSKSFVIIEHKVKEDLKTSKESKNFIHVPEYWSDYLLKNNKTKAINNIQTSDMPNIIKKAYEEMGVKSIICVPLGTKNYVWGGLFLVEYNSYIEWKEEQIKLLETIAAQIYIAINQADLYAKTKKNAEREQSLRRIVNVFRQSLDMDEIKNTFINEVGKYFNADRCFIYEFGPNIKSGIYFEYTSSQDVKRMSEADFTKPQFKYWEKIMFEQDLNTGTYCFDLQQFIMDNGLQNSPVDECRMEFDIKTTVGIPIIYTGQIFGSLIVQYTKEITKLPEEDINFLKSLAEQASIALHQGELYKEIQAQAERERISRNIIEILRSSIDKTIIKRLFVKNIGKFFNAERVFFSEYDQDQKIYLPVDENSEYLSSIDEKSFVGFDWSNSDIQNWIRPLLEKREMKIVDWDEYVKQGHEISESVLSLYKETQIKSKYGFPVIYQDRIMGFFCIEFTKQVSILTDEDIGRIRSICTQAGIALYHADLYSKAQECYISKESFKFDLLNKIKEPTYEILEMSNLLIQNEFERNIQLEYLNNIINSCNILLELTSENSKDD